jgi:alkanesulfonate monooxygenase SsuD/methylene tetrahydromethanopterin reductase-like flavin-dependent oxidoreductase (luciferase family)
MRFGLGPLTIEAAVGKNHVDVYEEALEQAVIAEWWGFDSVWLDERNFTGAAAFNSSSAVLAAAVAQRTSYVRVGMMPILGLVNAMYVAEEVACVDNISGGRVIVAGQVPSNEVARGWGGDNSVARIRDDLAVLRKAWGPNPFNHHSDYHTIPGELEAHTVAAGLHSISVQPKPAQLDVPLWLVGGDTASSVAAAEGVPYFGPAHLSIDDLRPSYVGLSPRPGEIVPLARDVFIAPTREEAFELARPAIDALYRSFADSGQISSYTSFDDFTSNRFIIGEPDSCIEQIYRYQKELGVNYLVARLAYHGMHAGQTAKAIQLFGQGVVPEFRMYGLPEEIRKVV